MRQFLDDRRGSVITVFALCVTVLAVFTAIVMNQISFYTAKRNLQAAVDMTAPMMMESGVTVANAKALIEEQLNKPVTIMVATQGRYSADASIADAQRFTANATPANAVQVNAKIAGEAVMLAGMMGGNPAIGASARRPSHNLHPLSWAPVSSAWKVASAQPCSTPRSVTRASSP